VKEPAATRVETLIQLRRGREAVVEASQLVARHPADADAMRLLAGAHAVTGDCREAVTWADRAVAAAPEDSRGYVVLSAAHRAAGQVDHAVWAARAAVRLAPNDFLAAQALAVSLADGRDYDAAWAAGHRLVALAPLDAGAHLNLGYTLHRWWPDQARAAYERCLSLDPTEALARQNIAALDSKTSPFLAIDGFASALAVDPTLEVAHRNLSNVVNRWVWLLVAATLIFAQALSRAAGPGGGRVALAVLGLAVVIGVVALWRIPRSVRRSLSMILFPGVRQQPWALAGLTGGLGVGLAGCASLVDSDSTALLQEMLVGFGAIMMVVSLAWVWVAIRNPRHRDHS